MQTLFRSHLQEIIDFLDGVVIKYEPFVELLNRKPEYIRPEFNEYEPTTFPYYRILSGDVSFASVPIYGWVPSLRDEVLLSRDSLSMYPDMDAFYRDEQQLNMLLKRYPDDTFLIKRILNPVVDIDAAIESPNLSLLNLRFEDAQLESYERHDILDFLRTFLKRFEYRWYINTFNYEDLHPIAFWAMLWNILPYIVLTRRMLNVRTNQVHSYFIWEYLASVGFGSYRSYLSRKQELFLYRNNEYLKFNVGKKFMLEILGEVFLKPIRYSLDEKMIVAHTTNLESSACKQPEVVPRKNKRPEYSGSTSFDHILSELIMNNLEPTTTTAHRNAVTTRFVNAPTNELMSKFIELIRNIDGHELMLLIKFILDSLAYLVSVNKADTPVVFASPIGGVTITFSTVIDALNLFYYAIYSKNNQTPVDTPRYHTSTLAVVHESVPVVPATFFLNGQEHRTDAYFDVTSAVTGVPYIDHTLHSTDEISLMLGAQFVWLFESLGYMKSVSDAYVYQATLTTFQSVIPEKTVLEIPQTHLTYNEYFTFYPDALTLLGFMENEDNYSKILSSLFEAICPLEHGFQTVATDREAASVLILKIKEIFTYLTSYNVTFFTTQAGSVEELLLPLLTGSCDLTNSVIDAVIPDLGRHEFDWAFRWSSHDVIEMSVVVENLTTIGEVTAVGPIELANDIIDIETTVLHTDTLYINDDGISIEVSDPL